MRRLAGEGRAETEKALCRLPICIPVGSPMTASTGIASLDTRSSISRGTPKQPTSSS